MLEAFKQLVDGGLAGWTLYLVGGSTPGEEHQAYLDSLKVQARGYPVVIYPDIPYSELVELYACSAIYWHASGYEEDEDREPEKSEHFGITTVEGMAAGCVPIVINKGGQPEIVTHSKDGFLWDTLKELQSLTLQVVNDEKLREQLASEATKTSGRYGKVNFNQRVDELMRKIGAL